jgi:hypothetical protein
MSKDTFRVCPLSDDSGQSRIWAGTICLLLTQSGHAPPIAKLRRQVNKRNDGRFSSTSTKQKPTFNSAST